SGKYNQAKDNELIALQIRQKLFGEMSEEVAASYNDLGLAYATTDNDKALEYYDKALPVYEQMHGKDHPKIAIANTNMGVAYRNLELYGDAIVNFEAALDIWKKIYPNGHPNEAFVLSALGDTYMRMNQPETAQQYFEKALSMYKNSYNSKHPDIAATLNQLGILRLRRDRYDSALSNFQEALMANTTSFTSTNITSNPIVNQFYNGNVLLYSLRLKAQALESKYNGETLKLTDLKLALATLHACDTLIDVLRQQSQNENDKLALSSLASDVYEDGVRIAASLSTITIDYKVFRLEAFYFMEKSKSAVLQEAIAESDAKSFSGIPSNLLEEEKNIKSSITLLVRQLAEKPTEAQEQKLRTELFNANTAYTTFTKKLEKDYPEYFNLKFNQAAPSVVELQKILDSKTAVISYFIAEESKRIYLFIVTKEKFLLKDFSLPEDFERNIKGFTNSILYSDRVLQSMTGSALYKLLVPRLPLAIHDLVIIPSGRLGTMPFEALTKGKSDSYSDMSFLIEKYAISYEFSTGLLIQKTKTKSSNSLTNSIFLCAPVNFPDNDALNELPGTVSEVNTISNLFSGNTKSVALYKEANETLVKSNSLSSYTYLHFATHGIV
ncbi:MAG TPA: tetratricopeptide repeat protein, partial [Cyclobacteriaceae bacterium]|nr:tetratricopeptide repeat protein [Cyclobacteriaceae bacterium]